MCIKFLAQVRLKKKKEKNAMNEWKKELNIANQLVIGKIDIYI